MSIVPALPPPGLIATVTANYNATMNWNVVSEIQNNWTISYFKKDKTARKIFVPPPGVPGTCGTYWCKDRADNLTDPGKSFLLPRTPLRSSAYPLFKDLTDKFGPWTVNDDAKLQSTDGNPIPIYIYMNKGSANDQFKIERLYKSDLVMTNCRKSGSCGSRTDHPTWQFGSLTQYDKFNIVGTTPVAGGVMADYALYADDFFQDGVIYTFRFSSSILTPEQVIAYGTIVPKVKNPPGKGLSKTAIIAIVVGSIVGVLVFVMVVVIALFFLMKQKKK
jgi:hypothetical protein